MRINVVCGSLTLLLLAACADDPAGEIQATTSRVSNTVVVTSSGAPDTIRVDSVGVLWRSSELRNPRGLLGFADRLAVADPTRVHFLSRSGEHLETVGREGEGPGEFGSIRLLGPLGGDTLAVHDARNARISFLSAEGALLGSDRATWVTPFVNPRGSRLARVNGGVVSFWEENVHTDRPTRTALVWRDLEEDSIAVLRRWDGPQWTEVGGRLIAHTELFPPLLLGAVAPDGRIAVGDGLSYCIEVGEPGAETVQRWCRDRPRVAVGEGIRNPALEGLDDSRRQVIEAVIRDQEIGESLPSFEALRFDSDGRLWVRTLGPSRAEIHPYLLNDFPERGPTRHAWDVFDREGRLLVTVELPATFDPRVLKADRLFGFSELSTGEIVIATAEVPFPAFHVGGGLP